MHKRSPLWMFASITVLFAAGYGVMFTVLDDWNETYGISEGGIGWIVGIGFYAAFVAQVLIAPLADRGHARRLLHLGLLLNLAGLVGMAFGESLPVFLVARVAMGVGVGSAYPAVRRILIVAEPDRVGHNLGRLLSADVGGFAAGPALGAILVGPFGLAAPFVVLAVGSLLAFVVVARIPVVEAADVPATRFAFDLLRNRAYAGIVLLGGALFLMIATFDTLWALVLDRLGAADWIASVGVTLFALPFIVLGSIGGRLAERFGPIRWAAAGLAAAVAALLGYGVAGSGAAMLAVSIGHSICDGLTVSSTGIAVARVAPPERQASAQGLLGACQTLVGGIAANVAGAVYEARGQFTAYSMAAIAVAVTAAAGVVLARPIWSLRGASGAGDATAVELGGDGVAKSS